MEERALTRALIRWFAATRRELPWRTPTGTPRDPYHVLVSETMLQQTQVARVVEKFTLFVERFPTVSALAAAEIDEVLALWSGLGYYRRARNLHAAARAVVERFDGEIPRDVDQLRSLPGVGRYTAGAVASIAFGAPVPAVDGNVQRVLLRLVGQDLPPASKQAQALVWRRAEELVRAAAGPGEWTEGLMELGATVCTPRSPDCPSCPLREKCRARAMGAQARIPAPKPRRAPRDVFHTVALVRDRAAGGGGDEGGGGAGAGGGGRVLLEQRPPTGMWAGLWQAPTIESDEGWVGVPELAKLLGVPSGALGPARPIAEMFTFQTTHRTVRVRVVHLTIRGRPKRGSFFAPEAVAGLGVSNLTRRVLGMKAAPKPSPEVSL